TGEVPETAIATGSPAVGIGGSKTSLEPREDGSPAAEALDASRRISRKSLRNISLQPSLCDYSISRDWWITRPSEVSAPGTPSISDYGELAAKVWRAWGGAFSRPA